MFEVFGKYLAGKIYWIPDNKTISCTGPPNQTVCTEIERTNRENDYIDIIIYYCEYNQLPRIGYQLVRLYHKRSSF